MRTKILSLALCVLFAMPCVLHAEEVEIQLMEVIGMSPLPGDDPFASRAVYRSCHYRKWTYFASQSNPPIKQ